MRRECGARRELLNESIVDGAINDDARRSGADLTGIEERAGGGLPHGCLEIGIGEHDAWRLTTKLQTDLA